MLKSFINSKTGEKIVFSPDLPLTKENVEKQLGVEIKGEVELAKEDEKTSVKKTKKKVLDNSNSD